MEEWELRWQITSYYCYCYSTPIEMFSMHTAHLANVSKSVTKNATFPRTGGLPCLITRQLHLLQLLGDSFSVSQQPPIWDPCSHYSMIDPLIDCNVGHTTVIRHLRSHISFRHRSFISFNFGGFISFCLRSLICFSFRGLISVCLRVVW